MIHSDQICKDVYFVGVNDRETRLFENLWPLDKGVSYNSYLIVDEKVALFDTVKNTKMDAYLNKIEGILGDREVDYLIINHMEPDHSGAIKDVRQRYPNVQIVGNAKTFQFIKNFYGDLSPYYEVKDGDSLSLGKHTLNFYMTPMVHWPETMMTYESRQGILFSGDAFGGFGSLDGGIFDDEVNLEFYMDEIRRYYSNIVGKFGPMVQRAIKKLKDAEIPLYVIASTHGPVWRKDPACILEHYDRWSRAETEEGVVIVYGSMYGNTQKMADLMARRLSERGIKNIRIYDASKTHVSYIISDIWRFKGVLLGSCAYNTGLFPAMQTVTHKIENSQLKDRLLGIFGTASWSGGGVSSLESFAKTIKWELVEPPVEALSSPKEEDYTKCINIANAMADRLLEERSNGSCNTCI